MTVEEVLNDAFDEFLEITNNEYLKDKVVLITGAGGSIGQKLAEVLLKNQTKKIILVDNSEANLFDIQQTLLLKNIYNFVVELANVVEQQSMHAIFKKYQPDIVYHTAAYKHVSLLENFKQQAFQTNVIGSVSVIHAALQHAVKKIIFVSTDKAVYPQSIMGITKRMAEIYLSQFKQNIHLQMVRFGNVPNTHGSVLPLWEKQLQNNNKITVVGNSMERYFISMNRVCTVLTDVLQNNSSALCVANMGAPVTIAKLAKSFLEKRNLTATSISYVKERQGEKEKEHLYYQSEITKQSIEVNYFSCAINVNSELVKRVTNFVEKYSKGESLNFEEEFHNLVHTIQQLES